MGERLFWSAHGKCWVPQPPPAPRRGPYIKRDSMDPIVSHADGKVYDSKSVYEAELRAQGYMVVGNDRPDWRKHKEPMPPAVETVKQVIEEMS